jgi:hypothetical protein
MHGCARNVGGELRLICLLHIQPEVHLTLRTMHFDRSTTSCQAGDPVPHVRPLMVAAMAGH